MKRAVPILAGAVIVLALVPGCDNAVSPIEAGTEVLDYVFIDGDRCVELIAGQEIIAGNVCVDLDGPEFNQTLHVTYTTVGGWEMTHAHMWIGESIADMPQTRKGNPKIGLFPYDSGDLSGVTTYTFDVPVVDLGNEPYVCDRGFHIAAQADLRKDLGGEIQIEGSWGAGDRFVERGNWGTYFTVEFTCAPEFPLPVIRCETSFAYGGPDLATCFLDIDEDGDGVPDFHNWGWSNGPLGPGLYEFDIYIGARHCSFKSAEQVGTLTVDYDGSVATVTYIMTSDKTLSETNLYVGSEILPRNREGDFTIAPSEYMIIHEDLEEAVTDESVVNDLSGDINVVAHAVVCGPMVPPLP